MTILSRAQIADMTGYPPTTLGRQLRRFPDARVGRGRYDTTCPEFAAWLGMGSVGAAAPASVSPPDELQEPTPIRQKRRAAPAEARELIFPLPSGWLCNRQTWETLRRGPVHEALKVFDWYLEIGKLRPHSAVPDLLPFVELVLPSGIVVNGNQWKLLRGNNERRAMTALDVLCRSWPEPRELPEA